MPKAATNTSTATLSVSGARIISSRARFRVAKSGQAALRAEPMPRVYAAPPTRAQIKLGQKIARKHGLTE
jgi:hypothetical protein